jgi:uncharacterized membrane protein
MFCCVQRSIFPSHAALHGPLSNQPRAIKLWPIAGLLRLKLWYYPTALAVFGLCVLYHVYRSTSTHSPWLSLIAIVDAAVTVMTWYEYRYLKRG